MTHREALDVLESRGELTARYRWLCSDENPDAWQRAKYRQHAVKRAAGGPRARPAGRGYPPLVEQARNAARSVAGFVADRFRTVNRAERGRRLGICQTCEHYDAGQHRCRKCGCVLPLKARIAREHCPINKW